jgi:hypothetical protein
VKDSVSVSLQLIAAGILTQAMFAGLFISGTTGARMTKSLFGAVLPDLAIVPAVSAWSRSSWGSPAMWPLAPPRC